MMHHGENASEISGAAGGYGPPPGGYPPAPPPGGYGGPPPGGFGGPPLGGFGPPPGGFGPPPGGGDGAQSRVAGPATALIVLAIGYLTWGGYH